MPRYDYKCPECEEVTEVIHLMVESPEVQCPDCQVSLKKIISAVGFHIHNTSIKRQMKDRYRTEGEMRMDLRENHGLHQVTPLGANDIRQTYKEIKSAGSEVKDKMQQQNELKAADARAKKREWVIKADKRVEARTLERQEMNKAKEAKKRAITMSS